MRIYLLLSLVLLSTSLSAASHCVILQYHHFSDKTPAITSVTPEQFDQHLNYLENNDFTVMTLRDVVSALQHQRELPDKCVALTVDDAYVSVYQNAYPRLKQRGWPMTVFVNSKGVDDGIRSYMTWDQMREMVQQGFSFENHSHSHDHLIRRNHDETEQQWLKRVADDIQQSQQRISDEIGISPSLMAYPYGEFNPALIDIVREQGLVGFGQQSGPAWSGALTTALPRFPMAAGYARLDSFITKVNTIPLPVVEALPHDPLAELGDKRPRLTLKLAANRYNPDTLRCYISGSDEVNLDWSQGMDTVVITPRFDLKPGRHRYNCTMPSQRKGRFHWYSHNWFVRHDDGRWYREY